MSIEPYKWYDYLPHDMRRQYYKKFIPETYWNLLNIRSQNEDSQYSLSGFEQKQCIFVHIPKCAGISVSKALFNNLGGGHSSIMDYKLIYSSEKLKDFYIFTFVRNPWDRIFSAYNFLKQGGFDEQDRRWSKKNLASFTNFDHFVCEWVTEENIYSWNHFIPQYKFLCNQFGNINIDFIGRFENIDNDFKTIINEINCDVQLSHTNKSNKITKKYTDFYTKKSINIIQNIYKKDIELFEYEF